VDTNGDGKLTVADLVNKYDVSKHPKFQNGEMTRDQVLKQFLKSFDSDGDDEVTPDEFLNYYSGVSASIDEDIFFDLAMRSTWKI
jgi:Ca2+-binding EF-hand superfamily protein